MAFVAPLIAGALGLGAVGTALINVGLALAIGVAARKLAPKPQQYQGATGARLNVRYDTSAEREIVFGEAATAGTIVYQNLYGPNGNDYVQLVYALADHPCDSLTGLWVNGEPCTWSATTGEVTGFEGHLWVRFKAGDYDQAADAELVAQSGGRWTSADRGRGVCHVIVTAKYSAEKFPSGVPRFLFRVRGARLYDWRLDSTAGGSGSQRWGQPATYTWTDNPIVALYNYRRGLWLGTQRLLGMNTPPHLMPLDEWSAAANACDVLMPRLDDETERRYRINGIISSSVDHREAIRSIITTTAGQEIDTGGILKPRVGVSQAVVAHITDDDLVMDGDVSIQPRRSRAQLVNAVFGTWHDPARNFERVSAPPRISPADEASDGGARLEQSFDLTHVTSGSQAQRILEIFRRDGRHQTTVRVRVRARFVVLEAGDWITWTSARHGFTEQVFRVELATAASDQTVVLALRSTSTGIYAWSVSDELSDTAPSTIGPGGPILNQVAGWAVATATIAGAAGAERPGLRATWTPIEDGTVVALDIEYRVAGSTDALTRRALIPSAGQHTWVDGVLGNVVYECRARPVTEPPRPVIYTSWVSSSTTTSPVVVDAAQGSTPPPDSVGPAQLDHQTRFELHLASIGEQVQGSAQDLRDQIEAALQRIAENDIASQLVGHDARAMVLAERIERATATSALASEVVSVRTSLDGATATITTQQTSIDGLKAEYVIGLDINGRVSGIKLAGDSQVTDLVFLLDALRMAKPGVNGGEPLPLFSVEEVGGQAQMYLNGDIRARNIEAVSLSAVTTNFGSAVFSGQVRGANDLLTIDFDAARITVVAPP